MGTKDMVPRLRFKNEDGHEFPEWEDKNLGDVGKTVNGLTYSPNDISNDGILVLRSSNVKDERVSLNDNVFVNVEKYNRVKKDDILICVRNGSRNLIGKNCLILKEHEGFTFGAFMTVFRSEMNRFLIHVFKHEDYKKQVHRNLGATINSINNNDFKNFKFSFPSKAEQQKIASFLSSVDEKISQLEKKKILLEIYKRGIMQKIFSQELRFKDENGREFPEWVEKKLGEIAKFFSGGTPNSSNQSFYKGDIPFIGSGDIKKKTVNKFITSEALESSSAKIIENGDLLYALYGATSGQVSISKLRGAINQAVLCIKTDQSNMFLLSVLEYNKERILDKYLQGGQGNLSAKIVKSFIYSFPCLEEQKKIASFLSSFDNKIEITSTQLEKTREFKKGLLQQMFV